MAVFSRIGKRKQGEINLHRMKVTATDLHMIHFSFYPVHILIGSFN